MPVSTQNLYFHLGMEADDDGVVEAYNVMNITGASEDDLKVLCAKGFVSVLNEDLVAYINDWHENNKIRSDRKIDSIYKDLLLKVLPDEQLQEATVRADVAKKKGLSHGHTLDVQWTSNGQPMDGIGEDRRREDKLGEFSLGKAKEEEGSSSPLFSSPVENSVDKSYYEIKPLGGTNGKGVVRLSDYQMELLLNKMPVSDFDHYCEVVADLELSGRKYKKSHYQAILDMAMQDGVIEGG